MINCKNTLRLSLLVSSLYVPLFAASPNIKAPDISDAMKAAEPPKFDDMKEKTPTKLEIVTPKEEEPLVLKEGETVHIMEIIVEETSSIDISELKTLVDSYSHRDLNMGEINELASKISNFYREKGYILAKAYVPKQNVLAQGNALRIKVVIGSYGTIHLNNNSSLSDSYLQRLLERRFSQGSNISQEDLERTMLLIQRTPGASVPKITLAPGESFGASDLNVDVPEGKSVESYIIGDNTGADPSGKYRMMAGVSWNSPLGIGDKLSLGGMTSNEGAVKNGRVAYSVPLGYDGLALALAYSKTKTDSIIQELPNVDKSTSAGDFFTKTTGDSDIYNMKLSYPLILSQLESLDAYIDLSHIKKENRSEYTSEWIAQGLENSVIPKKINVARFGLEWERFSLMNDQMFYHTLNGELSVGNVDNNGPYSEEDNSDGGFSKFLLSYTGNLTLDETSNLLATLKAQKALGNKTLDDFERLSLGGSNGVKVFTDSEFSADTGYTVSLEYQYKLPTFQNIGQKVGFFVEYARGLYENDDEGKANSLSDAGVAYYAITNNCFVNAKWAHILGSDEAGANVQKDSYRDRVILTLGMMF